MPETKYIPQPKLEIDGRKALYDKLMEHLMEDILQISVEESLHLPGLFTLVIKNDYTPGRTEDAPWRYGDLLKIGKPVKIGFESSASEAPEFFQQEEGYVLEGEITGIETHFTAESQAPIVVRGYDVSHRLHRGRFNRSFQNVTDSDIIQQLAGEVGIPTKVDPSGEPHEYLFQENQTNMEFCRERAARIGFELFVQDGTLFFRKPQKGATLELTWLQNLHSFRVRTTSAEQVREVQVRGWDYSQKQAIVATKQAEQVLTKTKIEPPQTGSKTSTAFRGNPSNPQLIVVDQPVFSLKEAETIAQSLCDQVGGEFIYADAKGEGNPTIRPGKMVKLKDMGPYTGEYYITETRHLFNQRVYTTEFSVRGLRTGNLFSAMAPAHSLEPGQTLMVGIVTDNKDPKGWGRVKVKFPTLTEQHNSNWARVVSLGASGGRGFDCLPEINDEVLVAFEHGDIHRPYVLGGLWNGKDAPPESINDSVQGARVRLRTFKTRTGHQMQFVEEDKGGSKAGVYIQTTGGHHIRINDSDQFVEVETKGGHKLRMDDRQQSITLNSTNTMKISAQTQIEITAPTIKVSGSGMVDVKGGIIKLN